MGITVGSPQFPLQPARGDESLRLRDRSTVATLSRHSAPPTGWRCQSRCQWFSRRSVAARPWQSRPPARVSRPGASAITRRKRPPRTTTRNVRARPRPKPVPMPVPMPVPTKHPCRCYPETRPTKPSQPTKHKEASTPPRAPEPPQPQRFTFAKILRRGCGGREVPCSAAIARATTQRKRAAGFPAAPCSCERNPQRPSDHQPFLRGLFGSSGSVRA